jgi:hypothetical protein
LIVFAIISVAVFFPQINKVFSQTATPENTGDNSSELKKEI